MDLGVLKTLHVFKTPKKILCAGEAVARNASVRFIQKSAAAEQLPDSLKNSQHGLIIERITGRVNLG